MKPSVCHNLVGRRVHPDPGAHTKVAMLPVPMALCVRIWTCTGVDSLIHVMHKPINDHGATCSFVCVYTGDVLRDHLSKMTQCLCTSV